MDETVNRDNPRMLQPAGNAGLADEPGLEVGIERPAGLELLKRHFPIEFRVLRPVYLADAAAGMERPPNVSARGGVRRRGRNRGTRVDNVGVLTALAASLGQELSPDATSSIPCPRRPTRMGMPKL